MSQGRLGPGRMSSSCCGGSSTGIENTLVKVHGCWLFEGLCLTTEDMPVAGGGGTS